MKKLVSVVLVLVVLLSVAALDASAENSLANYSDAQLKQLYEAVKEEMLSRGLPLAEEITLREGKFIVGQDILPGTYTLKCTETAGETYGGLYSSLGDMFNDELGGLMGSLGDMMGEVINARAEIIGDYGTVLKSYELKAGESVRITLEEETALQISDGTCVLLAD